MPSIKHLSYFYLTEISKNITTSNGRLTFPKVNTCQYSDKANNIPLKGNKSND